MLSWGLLVLEISKLYPSIFWLELGEVVSGAFRLAPSAWPCLFKMDQLMSMSPAEYTGEAGTCVYGRVVLTRGPFKPEQRSDANAGGASKSQGKRKKEGKGKKSEMAQESLKTEIHILGGSGIEEVLFLEGWADGARQLANAVQRGHVYRIAGAKKVASKPRFSTSKLPYFLRFVTPIGVNTKIEEWTACPFKALPLHHPFVELKSLQRVADSMRVSLIGVVSDQPGLVPRETKYGPGAVCNAVIRQSNHLVRCGFWRNHGETLAQYPVGVAVALHQVNVYHKNGGWEVASTEGTQIEECPAELREELLHATDLGKAGIALTAAPNVDYNVVKTKPSTLSGLASVILPQCPRDLEGVYEVHSIAVLGVSSVLNDGSFTMRSCATCKAQVREGVEQCEYCADPSALEQRWIFSLDMADQSGSCTALLYHDAAKPLPFLDGDATDDRAKLKIIRTFQSKPWSARFVYRKNEVKNTNYLEIKKLEPTLTAEGVVASFRLVPSPRVNSQNGCPFARCAEVAFDNELGVTTVCDNAVLAVRLLVVILPPGEDDLVATPDVTNSGFRVCRKVKCSLAEQNAEACEIKLAGIASSVQWLMTAPAGACFLITAKRGAADKAFTVLAHEDTTSVGRDKYDQLLRRHLQHTSDVVVQHSSTDTPKKRLASLGDAVPFPTTPQPFNKRQKLDEA